MKTPPNTVDGRVVRGTRAGPVPLAGQWVIVHRVGPDRQGPLDSTRTDRAGHYHLRYRLSGDSSAVYFASTSYDGIAYFTSPLRAPDVRGDDGTITVFDTTSGPVAIKIGGRHLVIGAPQSNGNRPVGEVYDLQNDSTVTAIARDTLSPLWTTHLPDAAVDFQVNNGGDVLPGAVVRAGVRIGLLAPVSPGIRQFAFTYELPARAFPLTVPVDRATGILEVLVQEPTATVRGPKLREVAPVTADGRAFRRYLGQDVVAGSVVTIDVPHVVGAAREKVDIGVGVAVVAAMAAALLYAWYRARPRRAIASAVVPAVARSQAIARAIADLDARFERDAGDGGDASHRAAYEQERASLKAELANALAGERAPR